MSSALSTVRCRPRTLTMQTRLMLEVFGARS